MAAVRATFDALDGATAEAWSKALSEGYIPGTKFSDAGSPNAM